MYRKIILKTIIISSIIMIPYTLLCVHLFNYVVNRTNSNGKAWLVVFLLMLYAILMLSFIISRNVLHESTKSIQAMIDTLDIIKYPDDSVFANSSCSDELLTILNRIYETRESLKTYITQFKENEQIRREFTANVSHELKTPLTTIKGFAEMLEHGLINDDEDIKKYGALIFKESTRLLSLIDDIIQLSQIEDDSKPPFEVKNIMQVIKDCLEILSEKASSHEITIHIHGDDNIRIPCNSMYITELILNIVDNSIKYNKPGGNVWINLFKDETNAIISIKDDGIGIKEQYQKRIFERFYRVDKSRSRASGGTGLGLSIVKHIVMLHNGSIQLFSKFGKGTEIIVRLPKKSD